MNTSKRTQKFNDTKNSQYLFQVVLEAEQKTNENKAAKGEEKEEERFQ